MKRSFQGKPEDRGAYPSVSPAQLEAFHNQFFLPLVWRATWKHGLSKEDARDIVQEAFLLALVKLRSDGNARAWLIQVVDYLCSNSNRKARRRTALANRWGLPSSHEADQGGPDNRFTEE